MPNQLPRLADRRRRHIRLRQPIHPQRVREIRGIPHIGRHVDALDRAWPGEVPAEDTLHERFHWHATEHDLLRALLAVRHSPQATPPPTSPDHECLRQRRPR
jgi:hypothetical protein